MLKEKIRIAAVLGSVKPDSNTSKALAVVVDELAKKDSVNVEVIDPRKLKLNLLVDPETSDIKKIRKTIEEASGLVLATPEYNGSYSSVIKLIIESLGDPSALAGKPIVLLGIAAGRIGAIKALEHLRGVCSHEGAIVLPWSISVAFVHRLFDEKGQCLDKKIEAEIRSLASGLVAFIEKQNKPKN